MMPLPPPHRAPCHEKHLRQQNVSPAYEVLNTVNSLQCHHYSKLSPKLFTVPPSAYRNRSLKTHIEGFLLVQLQLFQDHPCLADKLIMAELVLIIDRKPAREQ